MVSPYDHAGLSGGTGDGIPFGTRVLYKDRYTRFRLITI